MTRTITFTRRPKLAPLRIVLNRNQLEFLNEMKTEEMRRLGRLERGRSVLSPTITEEFQVCDMIYLRNILIHVYKNCEADKDAMEEVRCKVHYIVPSQVSITCTHN